MGEIAAAAPSVTTYAAAQTIPASGALPAGGGRLLALRGPVGGDDEGLVVVSGAQRVSASVDASKLGPIQAGLRFWHYVDFGSQQVPDALLPWDGSERATEKRNQPLSVEVSVPYG